jgi:hypothetical protein
MDPRELRHSFVSLLSDVGVRLEEISRLVGHSGTSVTELVYRHQIRPVIQTGATIMDQWTVVCVNWPLTRWEQQDSNLRLLACKASALTS